MSDPKDDDKAAEPAAIEPDEETAEAPRDPTRVVEGEKKSLAFKGAVAPRDPTQLAVGDRASLAFTGTKPPEEEEEPAELPPSWSYGADADPWNPTLAVATEAAQYETEAAGVNTASSGADTPNTFEAGMEEGDQMAALEDATDVLDFNPGESLGFRLGSLMRAVMPGADFPEINYNFIVLIGAFPLGDFQSVENIQYKVDPLEYKEGGRNFSPKLLPFESPNKRGELTLKWGTVVWTTLYDWMNDVEAGGNFRREVFVVQLARDGWPTRLMRFGNCWPIEWKAADLDTSDSKWSMESVTLVYERFNMIVLRGLTSIL